MDPPACHADPRSPPPRAWHSAMAHPRCSSATWSARNSGSRFSPYAAYLCTHGTRYTMHVKQERKIVVFVRFCNDQRRTCSTLYTHTLSLSHTHTERERDTHRPNVPVSLYYIRLHSCMGAAWPMLPTHTEGNSRCLQDTYTHTRRGLVPSYAMSLWCTTVVGTYTTPSQINSFVSTTLTLACGARTSLRRVYGRTHLATEATSSNERWQEQLKHRRAKMVRLDTVVACKRPAVRLHRIVAHRPVVEARTLRSKCQC